MPQPKDLVYQQSSTSGTGDLTLTSQYGKQTFASAFGTGVTQNVFDYFISSRGFNEWEVGTGHMSDSTTLVRDTVLISSNSNGAVNFTTSILDVTNDIPSQYQVRTSTTSVTDNHAVVFSGTSGSLIKSSGTTLGTIASVNSPVPVANGGTGSTSAADARTALSAQQSNATLTTLSGLSLASGDTLYASAASTLERLAKGTNGNVLKLASGIPSWGLPFTVRLTPFTSSGTYTPPSGLIGAIVVCIGGGGAGTGVSSAGGTAAKAVAGGGGGGGATSISFLTAAQIGTSPLTVTIGSGGAVGTAPISTTTTFPAGGNGTATSLGSLVVAAGGSGAPSYTAANTLALHFGNGGLGGTSTGSTGTIILVGRNGQRGTGSQGGTNTAYLQTTYGGEGGSTYFGCGSRQAFCRNGESAIAGIAPQTGAYGCGGGGAAWNGSNGAQAANGAAGQSGFCAIFELYLL